MCLDYSFLKKNSPASVYFQRSYFIKMDSLPEEDHILIYTSTPFAVCGFNIVLHRTRMQTFFQEYLTCMLFVVVSWVSFIIKPDAVPGRMAVLVTVFLVLINIFNGA